MSDYCYKGVPLNDMSKEELLKLADELLKAQEQEWKRHDREMKTLLGGK